jgi:hypothetical protein
MGTGLSTALKWRHWREISRLKALKHIKFSLIAVKVTWSRFFNAQLLNKFLLKIHREADYFFFLRKWILEENFISMSNSCSLWDFTHFVSCSLSFHLQFTFVLFLNLLPHSIFTFLFFNPIYLRLKMRIHLHLSCPILTRFISNLITSKELYFTIS